MGVIYLARHAETVFNRAARMQGNDAHTPLTLAGVMQADAMGAALVAHFAASGEAVPPIWCSTAGRTQQTAAIVADHLGVDFFAIRQDARLREIEVGRWTGRSYAEIVAAEGPILDLDRRLFRMPIPGGESYADIAVRLRDWMREAGEGPMLVISHGMTARVLRGILVGGPDYGGVPIAVDVPQGTVMRIDKGAEVPLVVGSGVARMGAA
ncbi:histidine phosphatase family protein [Sandaracinobacteroides saxicola]|uniref:Histidine phosphatase family protein n=1 Tax=Sandaracinobacteroides saxicola TaxID=2759707 RepID=A0A7G5IE74_9SPHN|nr:histidine phosphatase family protein [Sandaracinobacteroides saxicola]QMW21666.1 histidine phosphatase family protein [Sandaracinobacteroides saxicola]